MKEDSFRYQHGEQIDIEGMTVAVRVSFGRATIDGGYALIAEVSIRMPGVGRHVAEPPVRDAEHLCPYTVMVRQGIHGMSRFRTDRTRCRYPHNRADVAQPSAARDGRISVEATTE